MKINNKSIFKISFSAICIALCYTLPFITGSIPHIGNMLLPIHIPVLLCGFICGPKYGLTVGAISPLLRSFVLGMPPLFPISVSMAFEMAAYGLLSGVLYNKLPKKIPYIYISLVLSMISGRLVWGAVSALLYGIKGMPFGFEAFITGAFINAIPGIILQIIIIPAVIIPLTKILKNKT